MYRVYIDDVLMYKPDSDLFLQGAKLQQNLNSSGMFTYVIDESNECYNLDKKMKSVVVVKSDEKTLFRGRVLNSEIDFYGNKTVTCEGELSFLIDSIQEPYEFGGTPAQLFTNLITSHNSQVDNFKKFKLGRITVVDANDYIVRSCEEYSSTKQVIDEKLIKLLGGYVQTRHETDGVYIDYLASLTEVNEQNVEFGENLLDLSKMTKGEEIATAIIPLGAKGEDGKRLTIESVNGGVNYVHDADAVEEFGWIFKTVEFDDVTLASNLKAKGIEVLNGLNSLSKTLDITAVDLNAVNKDIASFEVGKLTNVISRPHNIEEQYLTTSRTINLLNPADSNLVLGGELKGISDTVSSNATIKDVLNTIVSSNTGSLMAEKVSGVIDLMNTSLKAQKNSAETSDVRAILFEDIDETSETFGAMCIGTQGIQISKQRDATGEWVWGTAINFEAINADYLITGIISDRQGRNYWNLETGEFSLSALSDYATSGDLESLQEQTTASLNVLNTSISAKVTKGNVSNQLSIETGGISIEGSRFSVKSTNFILSKEGKLTAKDADVQGAIKANSGILAGWKINEDCITNEEETMGLGCNITGSNVMFWSGGTDMEHLPQSKFIVYKDGSIKADRIFYGNGENVWGDIYHNGTHYYRDSKLVGFMGRQVEDSTTIIMQGSSQHAHAVGFGHQSTTSEEDDYTFKFGHVSKVPNTWVNSGATASELNGFANVNMNGWKLHRARLDMDTVKTTEGYALMNTVANTTNFYNGMRIVTWSQQITYGGQSVYTNAISFPSAFTATPQIYMQIDDGTAGTFIYASKNGVSSIGFNINARTTNMNSYTGYVSVMAIGKWK